MSILFDYVIIESLLTKEKAKYKLKLMSESPSCEICGSKCNLKACSSCHSVFYCSVDHQKEDWKKSHKANCPTLKLKLISSRISGSSSEGASYLNVNQMWESEIGKDKENCSSWYGKANDYWAATPPTIDGMLGGLSVVDEADVKESLEVIDVVQGKAFKVGNSRALDCGAGIGRVTKNVLSRKFATVDLVDQCKALLEKGKEDLSKDVSVASRLGCFHVSGLQELNFQELPKPQYDVIWIQWVIIYLCDNDFIQFLKRCKEALLQNGVIIVKDNVTKDSSSDGTFWVDKQDNSIIRSEFLMKQLFEAAGLKVVLRRLQPNFPEELFPVISWVLK